MTLIVWMSCWLPGQSPGSLARRSSRALAFIAGGCRACRCASSTRLQTRWSKKGILSRPSFRLWGTPYTSYATLVFLAGVTALMCYENYWNLVALVVLIPALVIGWFAVRTRVMEVARERVGITGNYPIVAETPLMDEYLRADAAKDTDGPGPTTT